MNRKKEGKSSFLLIMVKRIVGVKFWGFWLYENFLKWKNLCKKEGNIKFGHDPSFFLLRMFFQHLTVAEVVLVTKKCIPFVEKYVMRCRYVCLYYLYVVCTFSVDSCYVIVEVFYGRIYNIVL